MSRVLVLVGVVGCAAHPSPPLTASPLASLAAVHADQVVTQGDVTYALGAELAIARGDVITTLVPVDCKGPCPAHVWTSAASIPALDRDGRWIVATRFDGTLWRIRLDGELEAIASRFGLTPEQDRVRAIAAAGTTVALLLDRAVLVTSDGMHLTRYELAPPVDALAVAHDRIALASAHGIELWDLATTTRRTFAISDARASFLDAESAAPQLVVSSPRGVWLEHAGTLAPLAGAGTTTAIAGARLWLQLGKRLYVVRDATALDTTIATAGAEPLFGAPNGDLWIGDHGLRRYTLGAVTGDASWRAQVQSIFERVCAHCHLPGGDADIDLSNATAWTGEHDELVRRVLVTRTMPPAGTVLSDEDRATLARWLGAKP